MPHQSEPDDTGQGPGTPDSRMKAWNYLLLFLFISAITFFYFSFTSNNLVAGFTSDDAVYLLLADLYSFRNTDDGMLYEFIRQQSYFPPVFPMVLGLLGGSSSSPALAASINVVFMLAAIFIAGTWMAKEAGNTVVSIAIAAVIFFLPGTLILAQELWSEFLFMAFLYGTLLLENKERPDSRNWLAMAVLTVLASLTRSAGIALIIAFCVILLTRKVKSGMVYAVISVVPFLFWNLARETNPDSPGYLDAVTETLAGVSAGDMFDMLKTKITSMLDSLRWLFTSIETNSLHQYFSITTLIIFLLFAILGFSARLRLARLDAVFIAAYMVIVFIWPYGDVYYVSRFLYPLLPLLFLYLVLGVIRLVNHKKQIVLVLTACLISSIIIVYPSTKQFLQRGYADVPAELESYRRGRTWLLAPTLTGAVLQAQNTKFILDTLPIIRKIIPEQECVYTFQAPLVMLHARRVAGILPAPEVNDDEFREQTSECRFILAMPLGDPGGRYPDYYPAQRLSQDQYDVTSFYLNPDTHTGTRILLYRRQ